jgi:hypothetical protein
MQQENLPHKGDSRVYIKLLGKRGGSFSTFFKEPTTEEQQSFVPTNCGGCHTPTTCKFTKQDKRNQ